MLRDLFQEFSVFTTIIVSDAGNLAKRYAHAEIFPKRYLR